MVNLVTEKRGSQNVYVRVDTDIDGKVISRREADYRIITVKTGTGSVGYVLLDGEGNTVPFFHRFINTRLVMDGSSENTRRSYAKVIKRLYAFLSLMGYSLYTMGQTEIYQLRAFLQGTGRAQCSNETVNASLSIIRKFLEVNGIRNETLSAKHDVIGKHPGGNEFRISNVYQAYDINLPANPHKDERVPKYISQEQYNALIRLAREAKDWAGVMLMHLMFRYGMRIGECLGLSEEDFVTMRISKEDIPTLIVRNRMSDRPDQKAKRKITPASREDYQSNTYIKQWRNNDYSHYYLTESSDFAAALQSFIDETREYHSRVNPKNYRSCEADIVYPVDFEKKNLRKNHYIFVNRLGKRLSAQVWGLRLKEYFIKAGIPIDVDRKDNNLSHRFRHGFAMMHAREMDPPVPATELQKMMHHVSIASTMIYYNPTPEDEYRYKTKMQNRFFDNNPEFNAILQDFLNAKVHYEE